MHAPPLAIPLVGEAFDTDDLVLKLERKQRQAIDARYIWTYPETQEQRARELGIHVNTFRERVRQAMYRLDDLDCARRRAMLRLRNPAPAAA